MCSFGNDLPEQFQHIEEDGPYQIFIKGFSGKTYFMNVHLSYTVAFLQALLWKKNYGHPGDLRLIYGGHQLYGHRSLESFGIKNHSTIHLTGRLGPSQETRNEKKKLFIKNNTPIKKYNFTTKYLKLWRKWFIMRKIVIYWLDIYNRNTCAEGGKGREQDKQNFINNFTKFI